MTPIYRTLQLTLESYGNSADMRHGCRQQLCIQNCGQTAADTDLVAICNLQELVTLVIAVYLTIPSPIPTTYRLATIPHHCHSRPSRSSKIDGFRVIYKKAYSTFSLWLIATLNWPISDCFWEPETNRLKNAHLSYPYTFVQPQIWKCFSGWKLLLNSSSLYPIVCTIANLLRRTV